MSWFSPPAETDNKITVLLSLGKNVNPSKYWVAQPLKICIYETTYEEWTPARLYEGIVCQNTQISTEVIKYEQYILTPGEKRTYHSIKPVGQLRWIFVGAEFQRDPATNRMIKNKVLPNEGLDITVYADNTVLNVITNKK